MSIDIIKWYCYLRGVFDSNAMSLLYPKELGSTECNLKSVCVLTVYPNAVCLFNKKGKIAVSRYMKEMVPRTFKLVLHFS